MAHNGANIYIYNAVIQNNCFVNGSHKYEVYFLDKNNAHVNRPSKDPHVDFDVTQCDITRQRRQ